MADKFKTLLPISTDFFKGESLTPQKLESVFTQIENAMTSVELVIGDPWHQSQDAGSPLANYPSYIANISRIIGDMSLLNPPQFSGTTNSSVEIVDKDVKVFALQYAPQSPSLVLFNDPTVFATWQASRDLLAANGDYHVDPSGRVYTILPTDAIIDTQASYDYDTIDTNYTNASFNVIPDPNDVAQTTRCTAGVADGSGYQIVSLPSITNIAHPNFGEQLLLPNVLSTMTTGVEIPSGFMLIWDTVNATIVENVVFYKEAGLATVKVLAPTELDTAPDRYAIMTIGSSIAGTVKFLRDLIYSHTHADNVTSFISHEDLLGIDEGVTHGALSQIVGVDDPVMLTNKTLYRPIIYDDDPTPVRNIMLQAIDGFMHFYDEFDFAQDSVERDSGLKTDVKLHLRCIPDVLTGKSADMTDSIHASTTPVANRLLALDGSAKFPNSVIYDDAIFASGTKMVFYQATAPTGWTQVLTQNDKALRVVSGVGGGVGGSLGLASSAVGNHTLSVAQIPAHNHLYRSNEQTAGQNSNSGTSSDPAKKTFYDRYTVANGGGGAHNHPLDLAYVNVIIASKD